MRLAVAFLCAGWAFSKRILATNLGLTARFAALYCCGWRWSSPLTAVGANNSYRTFVGGLHLELSLDRAWRRCRSQRPLLPQPLNCPRLFVVISLRDAADQRYRQPHCRILSRILDRTRAA